MCPVGKNQIHSKCTQSCEFNVPSGQMLITFKMYPAMWLQCAQGIHGDHIYNVPINLITMCPVETWWSHSQCTQWWDHNVLSGHMLSSFKMYPVMGSQCPQWAHVESFHNVPINVITMSPVAYIMVSFTMWFTMYPACPWATHSEFFQKLSSNGITMSPGSFFQCNHNISSM